MVKPSMIRYDNVAKDVADDAYREWRERNNVAVRKSRAKKRAAKSVMIDMYEELSAQNSELRFQLTRSLRELTFLRCLLVRSGKKLPKRLTELVRASREDGPLGQLLHESDHDAEDILKASSGSSNLRRCSQLVPTPSINDSKTLRPTVNHR
ncbi:hypothetical protein PHET_04268 [Paragonimus heterotremus]|uniref:BZIP domain-containing protein n=1 Tax=Paragonimus heterotremus TaxID=100268 RepID=A0A8J4WHC6_9TREM|nr:hypothetical protein PHET_04268 [Paragonimus heterotremus]